MKAEINRITSLKLRDRPGLQRSGQVIVESGDDPSIGASAQRPFPFQEKLPGSPDRVGKFIGLIKSKAATTITIPGMTILYFNDLIRLVFIILRGAYV